ncbi:peroxiredoxin [Phenylobacterium zucineum HLK1]|uniref:thioredoxin-dependent peroxiredoxin n=1 Tax=Phenylobacterium zucineum (strain HLK1) TaxID=450851 RepID=B4RAF2_PHEZH|nr:peroxiredoxin [Phenylobacterium zucineum]ACG77959.1 peroxiredoxin [Phenylobacterium zucineum HLK1]
MHRLVAAAALCAVIATPAAAALKPGDKAPDFTAQGYQAGKPLTFSLAEARKKGPVVLYFFPAADTKGCNIEAKMFADAIPQFQAAGATVIGVTAGNLDKLQQISSDTDKCSGKFPVAADPGAKIAKQYDAVLAMKPDWSDRTSYVIAPGGQVIHTYSKLDPSEHVSQTLSAVKGWKAAKK